MEVRPVEGTNLLLFTKFETKYKVGSIIKLKSGSPPMTVVACDESEVKATWFLENHLQGQAFPLDAVKEVKCVTSI